MTIRYKTRRNISIALNAFMFILFTGLLFSLIFAFSNWYIGIILMFFVVYSTIIVSMMFLSLTSLIRIIRGLPTLEERVKTLEDAIYDEPNNKK